ncbi:site-specific DNA-methyltransferase, partial [Xenorhabdus sp. Sc-CR9]|uniref:site-specific DNA-methyltransferase n=1 Tax=Xenorhabdus sp. Sc-CR9 TaxID=2584468 RepID=UPI001F2E216F
QFAPVQYSPGKHPCEKPLDLMTHIIQSSSKQGDMVADFFMGSGATLKAALKLNRRVLGVELEEARFKQTEQEINEMLPAVVKPEFTTQFDHGRSISISTLNQ